MPATLLSKLIKALAVFLLCIVPLSVEAANPSQFKLSSGVTVRIHKMYSIWISPEKNGISTIGSRKPHPDAKRTMIVDVEVFRPKENKTTTTAIADEFFIKLIGKEAGRDKADFVEMHMGPKRERGKGVRLTILKYERIKKRRWKNLTTEKTLKVK